MEEQKPPRTKTQQDALQRIGKVLQATNTTEDLHAFCDCLHERWQEVGLHPDDARGLAGVAQIKSWE